jgi:hypothetical protein
MKCCPAIFPEVTEGQGTPSTTLAAGRNLDDSGMAADKEKKMTTP